MKNIILITSLIFFSLAALQTNAQSTKEKAVNEVNEVLSELSEYNYGEPQHWKPKLIEAMKPVYNNEAVRSEVEKLMLEFLKSDAAPEAKQAVQKEFSMIATKDSEKEILEMLKNEKMANIALAVLDHAELGTVNQFKKIIPEVSDLTKTGIINLLGNRADKNAVELLENLAKKGDEQVAMAAISALAKIGTPEAAGSLQVVSEKLPENLENEIAEVKVKCAYRLLENGYNEKAKNSFLDLNDSSNPVSVQSSALSGLYAMSNNKPEFIYEQLQKTSNPELKSQIIRMIIELPENYQNGKEFFEINGLSVQDKIQLIKILGDRKDKSVHDIAIKYLKQENENLQKAALEILPKVGSENDVVILAEHAAETRGNEQELAKNALSTLPGKKVNERIIELLYDNTTETDVKKELISAAGARNMNEASEILFHLAKSENASLKTDAIEALGNIGNYSDLGKIMELLVNSSSSRDRRALEDAAYFMAEKNPEITQSSGILKNYLKKSEDEKNITSIISILGKLGNPEDYKVISSYYENSNSELQTAAIRAVAEWPTAQPLDDLTKIMKNTQDARQHALAMRSYLQIIESNDEMGMAEKTDKLNVANQLSNNLVEKRMIIAAYSRMRTTESLQQLVQMMGDPEVRAEAEVAIQEMAPRIRENDNKIIAELKKAIQHSENESFIKSIKEEIERRTE